MNNSIQDLKVDTLSIQIITFLTKNPHQPVTVEEIYKRVHATEKTNYASVYRRVENLIKQGFLKKNKYGSSNQIFIAFNDATLYLLSLLEVRKKERFMNSVKGSVKTLNEKIIDAGRTNNTESIVIFGSYAKGKQRTESDIDLLVLYDNDKAHKSFKDQMTKELHGIQLRFNIEINPIILEKSDYDLMMREADDEKKHNIGNEAYNDHVILYGEYWYWKVTAACYQNAR